MSAARWSLDQAAEVAVECPCPWPGRCAGYGSPGCRMKADERLHVDSERVAAPAAPSLAAGAIGRGLADAAEAYRRDLATLLDLGPWDD